MCQPAGRQPERTGSVTATAAMSGSGQRPPCTLPTSSVTAAAGCAPRRAARRMRTAAASVRT
jgi:hypothetical protein